MVIENKVLVVDLDGTLLEIGERWYKLYVYLAEKYAIKKFSKKHYINLKRESLDESEFFESKISKQAYVKLRSNLIEKEEFLRHDKLKKGVKKTLSILSKKNILILLTKRKNTVSCREQLKKFAIDDFFQKIIITANKEKEIELMLREYDKRRLLIIGDTEGEILAGKRFGLKCIMVSDGARSHKFLQGMRPDLIIDRITELIEVNK